MTPEEDDITVDEVMRRWELPGDHPDSWVQRNATYRQIWDRAIRHLGKARNQRNDWLDRCHRARRRHPRCQ
jgi:hypothetical protein